MITRHKRTTQSQRVADPVIVPDTLAPNQLEGLGFAPPDMTGGAGGTGGGGGSTNTNLTFLDGLYLWGNPMTAISNLGWTFSVAQYYPGFAAGVFAPLAALALFVLLPLHRGRR